MLPEPTSGSGNMLTGAVQIESVAPGIYTANARGFGVAAALVIHIRGDGSVEQTLTFDPFTGAPTQYSKASIRPT